MRRQAVIAGWSNAFVLRLCLWAGVGLLLYFLLSFYASGLYALIYGVLFCGGMALHVRWHDFGTLQDLGTGPDRTLVGAYKLVLGFYGGLALYIVMLIVGGI